MSPGLAFYFHSFETMHVNMKLALQKATNVIHGGNIEPNSVYVDTLNIFK